MSKRFQQNDQSEDMIIKSSEFNVCANMEIDGFLSSNRSIALPRSSSDSILPEDCPPPKPPKPTFYVKQPTGLRSQSSAAAAELSHIQISNSKVGLFDQLARNKQDYNEGSGRQGRAMNEVFPGFRKLHMHLGRQVNGESYVLKKRSSRKNQVSGVF